MMVVFVFVFMFMVPIVAPMVVVVVAIAIYHDLAYRSASSVLCGQGCAGCCTNGAAKNGAVTSSRIMADHCTDGPTQCPAYGCPSGLTVGVSRE